MSAVEDVLGLTPGQLANNGMEVQGLQKLLTGSETNLETVIAVITGIEESGAWHAFTFHKCPGQVFRWRPSEFRKFVEADRPAGCQTPLHVLEHLLRGTPAWEAFLSLTRGEPGGDNNPHGCKGKPEEGGINCDIVTVDSATPPPTGNSTSYALRRLSRARPDLYGRVKARELSAHAAMVEAGFRDQAITIPADPRKAARRLVRHFSREQFSELVDEALSYYRKQTADSHAERP